MVQGPFTWSPAEKGSDVVVHIGDSLCLMCGIGADVTWAKRQRYGMLQVVMGWHTPVPVVIASAVCSAVVACPSGWHAPVSAA